MPNRKTQSDLLFEDYLVQHGFQPDYEPTIEGKTKHMDYRLMVGDRSLFFEVKEFNLTFPTTSSQDLIRGKIHEAREQFRQYKEYCSSLVLSSPTDAVWLSPDFVFGATRPDLHLRL